MKMNLFGESQPLHLTHVSAMWEKSINDLMTGDSWAGKKSQAINTQPEDFKYLRIPTCSHFVFWFSQQTPTKTFEPNNPCSINLYELLQVDLAIMFLKKLGLPRGQNALNWDSLTRNVDTSYTNLFHYALKWPFRQTIQQPKSPNLTPTRLMFYNPSTLLYSPDGITFPSVILSE